jgi:dienelactone hydrolase
MALNTFFDIMAHLDQAVPPQMVYDGDDAAEPFRAWQQQFRAKIRELKGPSLPRPEAAVTVLDRVDAGDHYREHVTIDSFAGTKVTAYILIPKQPSDTPRPGVLAVHGHVHRGKERIARIEPLPENDPTDYPQDYGLAAVRAGFVTVCPDWWGFGERKDTDRRMLKKGEYCTTKTNGLSMYGFNFLSLMIDDAIASLDALAARADVDKNRIGVVGHSLGGRMAMWLAAMDERIKCAVPCGAFGSWREESHRLAGCGAQFFPGILRYGDVQEVMSLIAPRPLMIMYGDKDLLMNPDTAPPRHAVVERAYRILDASDALRFHVFDGPHSIDIDAAIGWLSAQFAPGQ